MDKRCGLRRAAAVGALAGGLLLVAGSATAYAAPLPDPGVSVPTVPTVTLPPVTIPSTLLTTPTTLSVTVPATPGTPAASPVVPGAPVTESTGIGSGSGAPQSGDTTTTPSARTATAARGVPSLSDPRPAARRRPDLATAVGGTARSSWVVLVLAAVLVVFLAVQWRVDRREPKLATAPWDTRDELLEFR